MAARIPHDPPLLAFLLMVLAGCALDAVEPAHAPSLAHALSGDLQADTVGATLDSPLVVIVTDAAQRAVPGVSVTWEVASGAGTVEASDAVTDRTGMASARWRMGTRAGVAELSVRLTGIATPIVFRATALADAPAQVEVEAGNGQNGVVGGELPTMLVVRVSDRFANVVPAAVVRWSIEAGVVLDGDARTDSAGRARARWLLGPKPGTQMLTVHVADRVEATFEALAHPGPVVRLEAAAGADQAGIVSNVLPLDLRVRALDAHENAVSGVPVQWTAVAGDATVVPRAAATDSLGEASAGVILGRVAGVVRIMASSGTTALDFSLSALPGPAAHVRVASGGGQTGTVGTALPAHVYAIVRDRFANPVPGVSVSWEALGGGAFDPALSSTDGDGRASSRWTLGPRAGPQLAAVRVDSAIAAQLSAFAQEGAIASIWMPPESVYISPFGGSGQIAPIARDAFGNIVKDAPLVWASTDTTVAVVDARGRIEPAGIGVASIVVSSGSATATATVSTEVEIRQGSRGSVIVGVSEAGDWLVHIDPPYWPIPGIPDYRIWIWPTDGPARWIVTLNPCGIGQGLDMNAHGQIVGWSRKWSDPAHPFCGTGLIGAAYGRFAILWDPLTQTTEVPIAAKSSNATAINDAGMVAGVAELPTGERRAFFWAPPDTVILLPPMVGDSIEIRGLDNAGHVIGAVMHGWNSWQGFVWTQAGGLRDLGPGMRPTDINPAGVVVGSGPSGGFRWTESRGFEPLPIPGEAISEGGIIVGGDQVLLPSGRVFRLPMPDYCGWCSGTFTAWGLTIRDGIGVGGGMGLQSIPFRGPIMWIPKQR